MISQRVSKAAHFQFTLGCKFSNKHLLISLLLQKAAGSLGSKNLAVLVKSGIEVISFSVGEASSWMEMFDFFFF